MATVGVRELRNSLSEWLRRVREGEEVVITDRGKPVARLAPLNAAKSRREELIAQGLLIPARQPPGPLPDPIPSDGWVGEFVEDQRR